MMQIWLLACVLNIWQTKTILPVGSAVDEVDELGWEVESAGAGVTADRVANRSGVGVEAEGKLQAKTKTIKNSIHHAGRLVFIRFKEFIQ